MKKPNKERILQVLNNVAEEYVDLGETDFATKQELCEAILYLRKESQRNSDAAGILKHRILAFALELTCGRRKKKKP